MKRLVKRLKLMTYNIHNGVGADERYDLDRIGEVIRAEEPDIVALQEVDNGMTRTRREDQSRLLGERLGMRHYHCVTCLFGRGEFGITVLSRFPLLRKHRYDITHTSSKEPRYCLRVDVEIAPGAELHVFNCHLGLAARERQWQQRQMLSEAILLSRDLHQPVVLMGDFNDRPLPVVHQRLRVYFKDAYRASGKRFGPTFRLGFIPLCLDHIYISPEIHVIDSWVGNGPLARMASDHRPLVAHVAVEWRPQRIVHHETRHGARVGALQSGIPN